MFNLSGSELVVIALLALVILGPEKLPGAIRRFGRVYTELKRLSSGFEGEFRTMLDDATRPLTGDIGEDSPGAPSSTAPDGSSDTLPDASPDTPPDGPPESEPDTPPEGPPVVAVDEETSDDR